MIAPTTGRVFRWPAIAVALVLLSWSGAAAATTWQLARGPSAVSFTISHLIFSEVEGRFSRFSGSVDLPGESFEEARIEADIDVASIRTGHRDRDQHLVSEDFFFADEYPRIRFVSRSVRRTGRKTYEIVGDLTIRGVTREIVLAADHMGRKETDGGTRLDFVATGSLDRSAFDLRWNRIWDGRAVLGNDVQIRLKVCLVQSAAAGSQARAGGEGRLPESLDSIEPGAAAAPAGAAPPP